MAWLYHNTKDVVSEFAKKYNCDLALAEQYLKKTKRYTAIFLKSKTEQMF